MYDRVKLNGLHRILCFLSFYSVLKISINLKKLAHLTKNKKLITKFRTNLQKFSYCKSDFSKFLEKASRVKEE